MEEEIDLFELMEDMDRSANASRREIIKAPFGWVGGKSKALSQILPRLPYSKSYIEVFGGSGAVLLARQSSKLEVYNDRFGGVTDFYRVIRAPLSYSRLIERLKLCLHSREEFYYCLDTWENVEDPVERAARWYYSVAYSFAQKGEAFGRCIRGDGSISGRHFSNIELFPKIHDRMKNVQVENLSFEDIIEDYDDPEAVFYFDPPYLETAAKNCYKHGMENRDHQRMLNMIFKMKGFAAVSGYDNALYRDYDWDNVFTWEQFVAADVLGSESSCEGKERGTAKEMLYIKEAR